jgi:hypothetical protein
MHQLPLPPWKHSWYLFLVEAELTPGPHSGQKDSVNEKFQWHHQGSNSQPSGLQCSALTDCTTACPPKKFYTGPYCIGFIQNCTTAGPTISIHSLIFISQIQRDLGYKNLVMFTALVFKHRICATSFGRLLPKVSFNSQLKNLLSQSSTSYWSFGLEMVTWRSIKS